VVTVIAFEVYVNGKKRCTAGVGERGVLNAGVNWIRRADETVRRYGGSGREELTVEARGMVTSPNLPREHVQWLNSRLQMGDVITFKVIETEKVNKPRSRTPADPERIERMQREDYEALKQQYGDQAE
jgi:hypothetical protein